jgi:hypothetical protein
VNTAQAQTDMHEEDSLEIERIYVLNAYPGKKSDNCFMTRQWKLQVSAIRFLCGWVCGKENPRAIRFYEKNGFVAFKTHLFILGDDEQTDIIMRKPLSVNEA